MVKINRIQGARIVEPEENEQKEEFREHVVEIVELNQSNELDEIDQMISSPQKRLEYVNEVLRSSEKELTKFNNEQGVSENQNETGMILNISPSRNSNHKSQNIVTITKTTEVIRESDGKSWTEEIHSEDISENNGVN